MVLKSFLSELAVPSIAALPGGGGAVAETLVHIIPGEVVGATVAAAAHRRRVLPLEIRPLVASVPLRLVSSFYTLSARFSRTLGVGGGDGGDGGGGRAAAWLWGPMSSCTVC